MTVLDSQPVLFRFWIWFCSDAVRVLWQTLLTYLQKVWDNFSIGILFGSLFDPWKRDIVRADKAALNDKIQIFFWNLTSRFIGFFVRTIVLIIGILSLFAVLIIGIGVIIFWITSPLLTIYLIYLSLNLFNS